MRAWSASLWLAYPVVSPTHKASNLAAFLAFLASAMICSSVSSLWCPLVLAWPFRKSSAKCRAWNLESCSARSSITGHLYDVSGHGEKPFGRVDFNSTLTAVQCLAADDEVEAAAAHGELRVGIEISDYLKSPRGYLAIFVHAVIQVDARVRISA